MVGTSMSFNVIGEIKGSEYPDEVILAGGHLDSWDVGEGAHDDGAGCVQAIEMIRTFKALGIRPKRTVRAVLFMNEENGVKGGLAYADSAARTHEKHILAIETDAGGFSPRGFGLEMPKDKKKKIQFYAPLFLPYGVYDFSQEEGGADISPLGRQGVPMAGLLPDPQRYFDLHHTNSDVFEAVSHRELKLGAVVMSGLVYLVSEYGL
jgi:Zn-dependent M28 family amino/carboxypeptidase